MSSESGRQKYLHRNREGPDSLVGNCIARCDDKSRMDDYHPFKAESLSRLRRPNFQKLWESVAFECYRDDARAILRWYLCNTRVLLRQVSRELDTSLLQTLELELSRLLVKVGDHHDAVWPIVFTKASLKCVRLIWSVHFLYAQCCILPLDHIWSLACMWGSNRGRVQ